MERNKALAAAFLPQLRAAGMSEATGVAYGKEEIICAKIQIVDYGSG
jgi:hypothetical protein